LQKLVDLHNDIRQKNGLGVLKLNSTLIYIAQGHTDNMAQQQKMDHNLDGKGPGDRATAAGYSWSAVGENIAMGFPSEEAVVNGWMNSPGHRANILNGNYTEVGFGKAQDRNGRIYWTTDFGRPRNFVFGQLESQAPVSAPGGVYRDDCSSCH
jgi:uncharacterized protein YkwD